VFGFSQPDLHLSFEPLLPLVLGVLGSNSVEELMMVALI
jgi:hypothetical protein